MKLTVKQSDLLAALKICKTAVGKKSTIPLLAHVLLDATSGKLTITGTNLDMAARCSVTATDVTSGALSVPAKMLTEYVGRLPDDDVTLSAKADVLTIESCESSATFQGMSAKNFPTLPEWPSALFKVSMADLRKMLQCAKFSISKKESRFTLNGALLEVAAGHLHVISTDGHRLSFLRRNSIPESIELRCLIPLAFINIMLGLMPPKGLVSIARDDKHLFVSCGRISLCSHELNGKFPDYLKVIAQTEHHTSFRIDRECLLGALKRVRVTADQRSLSIQACISGDGATFRSKSIDAGSATECIPIETDDPGKHAEFAFNADYLLEWLRVTSTETVALRFGDGKSPIEMMPIGISKLEHRYVMMPMRII